MKLMRIAHSLRRVNVRWFSVETDGLLARLAHPSLNQLFGCGHRVGHCLLAFVFLGLVLPKALPAAAEHGGISTRSVAVALDFSGITQLSQVALDESWYNRIFSDCKRYGLQRVYFRIALGRAYYRSKIMAHISRENFPRQRTVKFANILEADGPEPLELAVKYAHKYGIEIYAWFPFNETFHRNQQRDLTDPWYAKRRDLFWCNRDGSRVWMGMPCVAEPEVVQRTVSLIEELCGYGVDGIFLTPRSHCVNPSVGDRVRLDTDPDEFGFNEPIRRRFLDRHHVDICRDDFDVAAWHRIKGEFYTEFLAACASAAHKHNKTFEAGTTSKRIGYLPNIRDDDPAATALRIYNDWSAWRRKAAVDGIVAIEPRLRLRKTAKEVRGSDVSANAVDVSEIVKDAPGCPVSLFYPVLASRPFDAGRGPLKDFLLIPPKALDVRIALNRRQGATGLILHEGYVPLFLDTGGEDVGIGPCPNRQMWEAFPRWNRNSSTN